MKISVVIPNYNGEDLLRKNLPKVIEALGFFHNKIGLDGEIIIVDDASTDSSVESIKYLVSGIKDDKNIFKIIQNEKNLGFSSSVNKGVKEASGEILVLLNTDIVPQKDFLEPLLQHFKDESVFAVGSMDKSTEGSKTILRGRGIGKWEKGFLVHARGEVDKTNTLWVSGGSGAFRKIIWEKLGGFDNLYSPFYWEDIDLSYRALKLGYKLIFEPRSIVVHEHEIGAIKSFYSSSEIKRISYKNQLIFIWKNITDIDFIFSHLFYLLVRLLKSIAREREFLFAFLNSLILIPKIIKSSFKQKKYFIKKDKEVLKEFIE